MKVTSPTLSVRIILMHIGLREIAQQHLAQAVNFAHNPTYPGMNIAPTGHLGSDAEGKKPLDNPPGTKL